MRKELQDKIFAAFPSLYCRKDLPMTETCMCWGIETGDGWFDLIYKLSQDIVNISKNVTAEQVKEKFGSLRFYYRYTENNIERDNRINELIEEAEEKSFTTCESCGSTDEVTQTEGWIVTLCKTCKKEYLQDRG
jgi:hypothetical protein